MAPDIQLGSQLNAQMPAQQMTLSGDEPEGRPAASAAPAAKTSSSIAPVWLQRLSLFVLVLFCVYLGVLVMVLPWWTRVWDQNLWIQSRPALAAILHTGAVRGFISGIGLLDIWIGISEAVHYRDHRG
ncbi:MAG: hypothetical protein NVSMB3_13040 [Acidobacteriaceae bacterium]